MYLERLEGRGCPPCGSSEAALSHQAWVLRLLLACPATCAAAIVDWACLYYILQLLQAAHDPLSALQSCRLHPSHQQVGVMSQCHQAANDKAHRGESLQQLASYKLHDTMHLASAQSVQAPLLTSKLALLLEGPAKDSPAPRLIQICSGWIQDCRGSDREGNGLCGLCTC